MLDGSMSIWMIFLGCPRILTVRKPRGRQSAHRLPKRRLHFASPNWPRKYHACPTCPRIGGRWKGMHPSPLMCQYRVRRSCGQIGSVHRRHCPIPRRRRSNDGAFGRSQHLYGFFDLTDVALYNRLVRADEDVFLRIAEFSHRLGDIFRNINNNGTRTAACGDLESFF